MAGWASHRYKLARLLSAQPHDDVVKFPPKPRRLRNRECLKTVYIMLDANADKTPRHKRNETHFSLELHDNPYNEAKSCPLYRRHSADYFLVVHFHMNCPPRVMYDFLKKGLSIRENGKIKNFIFFGHSASQLREATCILYDATLGKHEDILQEFGHFEKILTVSKRAARMGLLLSSSKPTVDMLYDDVERIDDIEFGGHNFTDGCGFVSLEVAKKITEKLNIVDNYSYLQLGVPSAYQIRLLGCKGMLILFPNLQNGVQIRPSMEKFKWNHVDSNMLYPLGVVDEGRAISRPNCYAMLNKQYILLLSALGVPDEVFLQKQEMYFQELDLLLTEQHLQVKYLCANEHFDLAEKLLATGILDNKSKDILNSICSSVRKPPNYGNTNKLLKVKKEPALALKFPIEESRNIYGVCDPSGILEYGTCFLQPTIRGRPHVLQGMKVIIAKNPCYCPGDVRVLTCVDVDECHHLVDVIVFPVQGECYPPS